MDKDVEDISTKGMKETIEIKKDLALLEDEEDLLEEDHKRIIDEDFSSKRSSSPKKKSKFPDAVNFQGAWEKVVISIDRVTGALDSIFTSLFMMSGISALFSGVCFISIFIKDISRYILLVSSIVFLAIFIMTARCIFAIHKKTKKRSSGKPIVTQV